MRSRQNRQINKPDLADVLENTAEGISKDINCVKVGEIVDFNHTRQTVSVQTSIKQVVDVAPDGTRRLQDLPLMLECPMVFLSGGGSHLTIPPKKGDGCLVLFNDRDMDNWFIEGGRKAPNTYRRHDLSDGFALVGVRNLQTAIDDFLTDGVQLRFDASNKMDLKSGTIETTTPLLKQTGNAEITGNATVKGGLIIGGTVTQEAGAPLLVNADMTQQVGKVLKAGNGASGSFTTNDGKTVTVNDGIITSIV